LRSGSSAGSFTSPWRLPLFCSSCTSRRREACMDGPHIRWNLGAGGIEAPFRHGGNAALYGSGAPHAVVRRSRAGEKAGLIFAGFRRNVQSRHSHEQPDRNCCSRRHDGGVAGDRIRRIRRRLCWLWAWGREYRWKLLPFRRRKPHGHCASLGIAARPSSRFAGRRLVLLWRQQGLDR
jgi:hypothetical protein